MFICIECHKASGCARVWRRDSQRAGQWIGLDKEEVIRIFGHSARVGAAQDLLALNIDMAAAMQAGRWKDTRMPMRYRERVLAARGGLARAAKEQGLG
jgi:hypothetical protein